MMFVRALLAFFACALAIAIRFGGWTAQERTPFAKHLRQHAARPEFTTRFVGREGSIAFQDNRASCPAGSTTTTANAA